MVGKRGAGGGSGSAPPTSGVARLRGRGGRGKSLRESPEYGKAHGGFSLCGEGLWRPVHVRGAATGVMRGFGELLRVKEEGDDLIFI